MSLVVLAAPRMYLAIGGWTLQWTFRHGEAITSNVIMSGPTVAVRDAGWNGTIPPGGSASVGFTGTGVPR